MTSPRCRCCSDERGAASVNPIAAPQFLVIALQAIWYLSPVFFEPKLFRNAGVGWLVDWNPVYYLLDLMRSPFLSGTVPPPATWMWFFGCLAFAALWALLVVRKSERSLIFYL